MQRTISILLSLLLLTSATGISYGQHFCGEHLANSMLVFSESALGCGMEMNKNSAICGTDEEKKPSMHRDSCCDNQLHHVETDDSFNGSSFSFNFDQNFALVCVSVFALHHLDETPRKITISNYYPPPIYKDIPVLYETFLI